ncbi:hypothetical protein B0T10DRAFT_591579, partial [Thelonectria olida]
IQMEWTLDHHPPILLLLRSLPENPELCSHVRSLRLDGRIFMTKSGGSETPDALPRTVSLPFLELSQAITRTGVSQDVADSWKRKTQLGVANAVIALLMSILPNLASLSLQSNWTIESHYLGHRFRLALCNPRRDGFQHQLPTFQALTTVETASKRTNNQNPADILALLNLPNIQTLSASINNPIHFAWPSEHPPAPLTLTSLELHRIREDCIGPVLSGLTSLQTLRYGCFYQSDIDEEVSDEITKLDIIAS